MGLCGLFQQFDQFRCCRNALDSLVAFAEDQAITRMTVAIVSILAAKIPTEQTTELGVNESYMKRLLDIVARRMLIATQALQELRIQYEDALALGNQDPPPQPPIAPSDVTLKFTLSALWNLTDESPRTCRCFLESNGLKQVMSVLQIYHDSSVETKVLGLVNNVAEVQEIKHKLTGSDTLTKICELLKSEHIDVGYFAAGILAHLCADEYWDNEPTSQYCESQLYETVSGWEEPNNDMVAYRSFKPFFPLLSKMGKHGVQMWAVWAIRHVCTKNPARYVPMFANEGGQTMIKAIVDYAGTDTKVLGAACDILGKMKSFLDMLGESSPSDRPLEVSMTL